MNSMSDKDLDRLEARLAALAEAAQDEKRKNIKRLRAFKARIMAIQSYLEGATSQAQRLYELIDDEIEEAEKP